MGSELFCFWRLRHNSWFVALFFLIVQWLRTCLGMQGIWVQSLVGELRSHMRWSNQARAPQPESLCTETKDPAGRRWSQIHKHLKKFFDLLLLDTQSEVRLWDPMHALFLIIGQLPYWTSRTSLCGTGCCGIDGPGILGTILLYTMQFYGPSLAKSFTTKALDQLFPLWGRKELPNLHLVQHIPQIPVIIHLSCYAIPRRFQNLTTPVFMME